jgi:hypothetical protein
LHVGYCLSVLGDGPDLLADVFDKLSIAYTFGTHPKTGRRTVIRVEPEAENKTPNTMVEVEDSAKGKRRRKRGERLDAKLDLRLPANERQELAAYAERKGQSVGEFARELLGQGLWYAKGEQLEKQEHDHRDELASNKPAADDVLTRFKRALGG